MVEQLRARGVSDERVLAAMEAVAREHFVPRSLREDAYRDSALPIESGQTISQPYIVAFMLQSLHLSADERVLEVGAGSGYAAAVLSHLVREVFAIERDARLVHQARRRMTDLGMTNVHIRHANGTLGFPEAAPFDAILVSASGPEVAEPLVSQLAPEGRLLMPVGASRREQELVRITRTGGRGLRRDALGRVRFVPLIGRAGWDAD